MVIGKDASRVSVENALEHVAGYTIVNEFSLPEDSYYRPTVKAKCRDGFCSLGPNWWPVIGYQSASVEPEAVRQR